MYQLLQSFDLFPEDAVFNAEHILDLVDITRQYSLELDRRNDLYQQVLSAGKIMSVFN